MVSCNWLPEFVVCTDISRWSEYEAELYTIFRSNFILSHPHFQGQQVNIRKHPMVLGKEEAFFHITCQDYLKDGDRVPDLRRCERIRWVRHFIENYNCDPSCCPECSGIKLWFEPKGSYRRAHILLEEERYMVVVEIRPTYCLLITAFYFDQDHRLSKILKRYEKYRDK